jgi:hypothetical protein
VNTALFIIELSVSSSSNTKVRKVLRRADMDRAVLHAETWLRKSILSGQNYVSPWYDQWAVISVEEGGEVVLARGMASTEAPRVRKKAAGKKATGSGTTDAVRIDARSVSGRGRKSNVGLLGEIRSLRPDSASRLTAFSRMSPRRAGIAAMVENAKRKLAENE